MKVHINSGDGGAKCGLNVFLDPYPNGWDSPKVNSPARKISNRMFVYFEDKEKGIEANCKRCLNKINRPKAKNLDKDYVGTVFHYSFGYDMTINVFAKAFKQTKKGLMCREVNVITGGDPWAPGGSGTAKAGSNFVEDSKPFLMLLKSKSFNGGNSYEYWTGGRNTWSIWDGREYYENHCD